jgi:hypothetical protein
MKKINKELEQYNCLPNQEGWELLDEDFRSKYREYEADFNSKDSTEFTAEFSEKETELSILLHELHNFKESDEIEVIKEEPVQENEENISELENEENAEVVDENIQPPENEPEKEEVMEENKHGINITEKELEELNSQQNQPPEEKIEVVEQETEKVEEVVDENKLPEKQEVEEVTETIVTEEKQHPQQQFIDYLINEKPEVVKASTLKKFNVPEELWKVNKPVIDFGSVILKKPFSGLMFNAWQVVVK